MNELDREVGVDLAAQAGDVHVDDVIERRRAGGLLFTRPRQRFPRDDLALMPQQGIQQLELADGQVDVALRCE